MIKNNDYYKYNINKLAPNQKNSLQNYILDNGESVWIRKINKAIPKINYMSLNLLAILFKVPALKSCYVDPYQSIKDEINIINNLTKNNINTLKILAYNDISIMTLDCSYYFKNPITLYNYFIKSKESITKTIKLSIQAILNIHSKNLYLSQAFIKNIMIDENKNFIFFDFEEDSGRVFHIYECQVKDCLFFILSSSYLLKEYLNESLIYWNNYIKERPKNFQNIFYKYRKNLIKINVFRILKDLGKDSKNFFYALDFLQKL